MEYLISFILIAFSALFSGLTLGFFSLNVSALRRKAKLGDAVAKTLLPVRERGNQLLTALLLGNVLVNATLSIYLGSIASGIVAGIIATSVIFLFGEIIPQAVISRHALWFGSRLLPIVKILLFITWPVAWPIGKMLNWFLGEEMSTLYSRHELMEIVSELEDSTAGTIDADEERIIHGALQFSHTIVREVMTDKAKVVSFDENQRFDKALIEELMEHGYSRYPIYRGNPDNIIGILFAKDLLGETPDTPIKAVEDALETNLLTVRPQYTLDTVLALMLKRKQHLAVVQSQNGTFLGIISLEDIIEEIIQHEIEDEDDAEVGIES
jgi:metal transporter CNNM